MSIAARSAAAVAVVPKPDAVRVGGAVRLFDDRQTYEDHYEQHESDRCLDWMSRTCGYDGMREEIQHDVSQRVAHQR